MYYFFNPDTLKIVGSSSDPNSLGFPSLQCSDIYHSFENLKAQRNEADQLAYENLAKQLSDLILLKDELELEDVDSYISQCNAIKEQMVDPNSRATLVVVHG